MKTSLSLEIAHECDKKSFFDKFIWISAKKERITNRGVEKISSPILTLSEIYDTILKCFQLQQELNFDLKHKQEEVEKLFDQYRILLIIDNFESVIEKEQILKFAEKCRSW